MNNAARSSGGGDRPGRLERRQLAHQGFACFVQESGGGLPTREQLLRFADAAELRVGSTVHYRNHRYRGTAYHFRWLDATGRPVGERAGGHGYQGGNPPADDRWHFGRAAEQAWTRHRARALSRRR